MLDHRPHRHLAQLLPVEAKFLDQRAERAHRHAEVADVGIGGVLATEGNADAAEDGDGAAMQHRDYLVAGLPSWRRSEEHTSELQSLMRISYAVFCLKKKTRKTAETDE